MPGEGDHFVSKMTDFANKPWVIRSLLSLLMCFLEFVLHVGKVVRLSKCSYSVHVGPPPSQQATGQQLYQISTYFPSFFLYVSHFSSPGSRRIQNEMCECVFHATKQDINQHKRISMTIPISLLPNKSASGLHWEWQKEMQVRRMTIQKDFK